MKEKIKEIVTECAVAALGMFLTSVGSKMTEVVKDKQSNDLADYISKLTTTPNITYPGTTPIPYNPIDSTKIWCHNNNDLADRPTVMYGTSIADCANNTTTSGTLKIEE